LWGYLIEKYGALELGDVLTPAIRYAREGFPVSPIISEVWSLVVQVLGNEAARKIFSIGGRSPDAGEIMFNKDLATVFEAVAAEGISAFYGGSMCKAIVKTVQDHGGFLTSDDLAKHKTVETTAISTSYRDVEVYEHPPNGQGFAALSMLNIMESFNFGKYSPLDAERYHTMIETKKLAYADLYQHNADPDFYEVPLDNLLSKRYAKKRADRINPEQAMEAPSPGIAIGPDTIYLATADGKGMAVSFINSLYMG
ncbi:unnamed protein product, partial [marine sediment metagenome]